MQLGGKGGNLVRLAEAGFPVPEFAVVPAGAFEVFAESLDSRTRKLIAELEAASLPDGDARECSAEVRRAIAGAPLPRSLLADIEARCGEILRWPEVAVRSSVVGEDSIGASFAGQMKTFLHVTRDRLGESVRSCWTSAFAEGAMLYRRLRKVAGPVQIAVVVQRMVRARAAGVLFTQDPRVQRRQQLVSAAFGLGEGVVGGLVDCDTFVLSPRGDVLETAIADKQQMVTRRPCGDGTELVPVPVDLRGVAALSDAELATLARHGRRAEELFGGPQDVEFAVDEDGELFVLQARPITAAPDRETVFDNANIVESFPGQSRPLTFAFAAEHYETVFREACRQFGLPQKTLDAERDTFANLLACISGRIYYNIGNWYRLFSLGGLESALPAWREALGVDDADGGDAHCPATTKIKVRLAIIAKTLRLSRDVGAFHERMESVQRGFATRDLEAMTVAELLELEDELRRDLVAPYAVSVVNDFAAQQLFGLLGSLITRWQLGDRDEVRNALLQGSGELASVAPVRSLFAMARLVEADPELSARFASSETSESLWQVIANRPQCAELAAIAHNHVARYGDRTLEELKLETVGMAEDPVALVSMLRNVIGRDLPVGAEPEGEAHFEIAARLPAVKRRLFLWVLSHTQRLIANREALRFERTRAFGLFKRIYRQLGARFASAGLIADASDVFWMTTAEVRQPRGDLKAAISQRRAAYAEDAELDLPGRISLKGDPRASFRYRGPSAKVDAQAGRLDGIACAAGRVRATARVLRQPSPDVSIDGEILVAPMTDPGWVYLMVASSGLVVEKGSVLSHTAIIGRELGIPTVIGVEGATRTICDGEEIEIDGAQGWVVRIES